MREGTTKMLDLTLGLAAFDAKDYLNAFRLLKLIADQGNAEAQCLIGNMYHLALGIERNILEAVKWYKKSANQGYGVASNNLAEIFRVGDHGVDIAPAEAEKWYQKAREQGFLHTRA